MLVTASQKVREQTGGKHEAQQGQLRNSGNTFSERWLNMIREQQIMQDPETKVVMKAVPESKMSLDKILLATDFSPASDRALEYALSLARHYGSLLYVTHIITLDGYPMIAPDLAVAREGKYRQEAKNGMAKIVRSGRLVNVPHQIVIEEGALWPAIHRLIEKYGVNLVVAGTQGMGSVQKVLLGSNAEQLFRQSAVPMLTVGPAAPSEPFYEAAFKHILFATDFGPGAEKEAGFGLSLAKEHRSRPAGDSSGTAIGASAAAVAGGGASTSTMPFARWPSRHGRGLRGPRRNTGWSPSRSQPARWVRAVRLPQADRTPDASR